MARIVPNRSAFEKRNDSRVEGAFVAIFVLDKAASRVYVHMNMKALYIAFGRA